MVEGVDAPGLGFGVLIDDQVEPQFPRHALAHLVHRLELPGGVHVQQGKRRLGGKERLGRQVQHHGAVLAHRIEHHRPLTLGHDLAHDVDALGLQTLKVGEHGVRVLGAP